MAFNVVVQTIVMVLAVMHLVDARGFLGSTAGAFTDDDRVGLGEDLQRALDTVLGCGGAVNKEHLGMIEGMLWPMWSTLPKNDHARVDWRSLRYAAHRFFMQRSSLVIRGFEPARVVNESHVGHAQILSQEIPALDRLIFGGEQTSLGFSLEDAVDLVATLEQLMFESETYLLETAYEAVHTSPKRDLVSDELHQVMEAYMVHWMMGNDQDGIKMLLSNRTVLETVFPMWGDLKGFVDGKIRTLDFARQRSPGSHLGRNVFGQLYSFDDAHELVGGITTSFASYWESECATLKTQLVAMDKTGSGRVRLSDFYGNGLDKDWRFGESEAYLRDLGVLDETSSWRGKQVLIANYMQAASNCIVSTPHYTVCCVNECEGLLSEIESEIRSPTASPIRLAFVVGNMTSPSAGDDDLPKLHHLLMQPLQQIAELHGGEVPLHGRLFAQWLHYVFPHECAFPHKAGSVSTRSMAEYGDSFIASQQEMLTHAFFSNASGATDMAASADDEQGMSQWSAEEELFADYSLLLQAPWEGRRYLPVLSAALFFSLAGVIVISTVVCGASRASLGEVGSISAFKSHSHLV